MEMFSKELEGTHEIDGWDYKKVDGNNWNIEELSLEDTQEYMLGNE